MKKKIFAVFLSLCMVLTMMPSMGFAQNTATLGIYKYSDGTEEIEENTVTNLKVFYVIANYTPKSDNETAAFYDIGGGYNEGISIGTTTNIGSGKYCAQINTSNFVGTKSLTIEFRTKTSSNEENEVGTITVDIKNDARLCLIYDCQENEEAGIRTSNNYLDSGELELEKGSESSGRFGIEPTNGDDNGEKTFQIVDVDSTDYIKCEKDEDSGRYKISFTGSARIGETYTISYNGNDNKKYTLQVSCVAPMIGAYTADEISGENLLDRSNINVNKFYLIPREKGWTLKVESQNDLSGKLEFTTRDDGIVEVDVRDFDGSVIFYVTATKTEETSELRYEFCVSNRTDEEYEPLDKTLLVCTSNDDGKTFTPIPVECIGDEWFCQEKPVQFFANTESGDTFYVLKEVKNGAANTETLTLPILDYYREAKTENVQNVSAKQLTATDGDDTGTQRPLIVSSDKIKGATGLGAKNYQVWKVTVDCSFDGAARVGFKFGNTLATYLGIYNEPQTKFMWILDGENYLEPVYPYRNGMIIPCNTEPADSYNSLDQLLESDAVFGETWINEQNKEREYDWTKRLNISLAPSNTENDFYVIHPTGTKLNAESYECIMYENNGYGIGGDPMGGNFCKKINGDTYEIEGNCKTVTIGEEELTVSKVSFKNNAKGYYSHKDIATRFTINGVGMSSTNGDGSGSNDDDHENYDDSSAAILFSKGMNVTIEGDVDGIYINDEVSFSQGVMDIEHTNLDFENNSAFYSQACALVSDEGQGRFTRFYVALKPGYVIEKITEKVPADGNERTEKDLFFVARYSEYFALKDGETEISTEDGLIAAGWNGKIAGNEDTEYILADHCFAIGDTKYMTANGIRHANVNEESVTDLLDYLGDHSQYSLIKKGQPYISYWIYFDPADDDTQKEIVFHVKKAESTGSDFSAKNNGSSVSDGAMKYDRLAADSNTKTLLKNNLTKIGTRGYEVLDVYDMKRADGNEASGLYNITIPASKLSGVDPTKCKVVYYADNNAVPLEMETTYTTDKAGKPNGIVFTTGHFSNYAIVYEKSNTDGGSSGGYVAPTTDTVTNKTEDKTADTSATTTATVKNTTTTAADGTKTVAATVDTSTANRLVEKAVENKSAEVVVDAATAKTVTETAEGTKTEITLPATTISDIAKKTEAAVTIKADAAEIKLDKEAVKAVAEAAGAAGEVKLEVETVAQNENKVQVDLKLVTSKGNISDFKGGSVSVTVKLNTVLATKPVVCVYIDAHSTYHKVGGQKNADGTFTFKTGHFSSYAIVAEEEADKVIAEQTAKVEKLVKALSLKARSAKTAKGYIKVNLTVSEDEVKAIEDLGYTVKYKFYRSTKKAKGYKAKLEGTGKTYTNTTGKKGTKYYYKARVMVYDAQGALVTKTELAQCKYACRTR